jgi:rhomboid protease GluP
MPDVRLQNLSLHDALRRRAPHVPVTQILLAANILVFVAMLAGGAGFWHSTNGVQLAWGANFGPATQDGEWWRLGSALFLHFGIWHLAMNIWALWDSGQLVERMFGSLRFAGIYFVSGLTGNLLSLAVQGDRAVSGGASGAIFGVFGALLVFLWGERRTLHPREFRWLFWGAAGFTAVSIAFGLLVPGIDNAAHIGGFVAGVLFGLTLARPLEAGERPSMHNRWLAGAGLALIVTTLAIQIPAPTYRWQDEQLARKEIGEFLQHDVAISREWQSLIEAGRSGAASFDELAGRIDSDVADRYEESFGQLSQVPLSPALPSAATVELLRRYAELRRNASRSLAEGLRTSDEKKIHDAFELEKQSRQLVQAVEPAKKAARR